MFFYEQSYVWVFIEVCPSFPFPDVFISTWDNDFWFVLTKLLLKVSFCPRSGGCTSKAVASASKVSNHIRWYKLLQLTRTGLVFTQIVLYLFLLFSLFFYVQETQLRVDPFVVVADTNLWNAFSVHTWSGYNLVLAFDGLPDTGIKLNKWYTRVRSRLYLWSVYLLRL